MIRSKLLQAAAFGALCLVGGTNTACAMQQQVEGQADLATKPNQVVVITESSSTTLTPEQFIKLQTRTNTLVEREKELLAAIQNAKNPGVAAALCKTLCNVTGQLLSLAKVGIVSAAAATSVGLAALGAAAYEGKVFFDSTGFIIRLFGHEVIGYTPYPSLPWWKRWIVGQ